MRLFWWWWLPYCLQQIPVVLCHSTWYLHHPKARLGWEQKYLGLWQCWREKAQRMGIFVMTIVIVALAHNHNDWSGKWLPYKYYQTTFLSVSSWCSWSLDHKSIMDIKMAQNRGQCIKLARPLFFSTWMLVYLLSTATFQIVCQEEHPRGTASQNLCCLHWY